MDLAIQTDGSPAQVSEANGIMRANMQAQRKAQVTALAFEFCRTISSRFNPMPGTEPNPDMGFLTQLERSTFQDACQHLGRVFRGDDE